MARLTANTVLVDPTSGDLVSLPAGASLPEWAEGLVGDHMITKEDESEDGKPNPKWTVAQIDAYAAEHRIDLGDASNKVEKLAVLTAGV